MIRREIKKIGGSLAVIIPRDIAAAMDVGAGDVVRLSLVGRQMVVEPEDDTIDTGTFRRAFKAVLRRYDEAFEALAEHDRNRGR